VSVREYKLHRYIRAEFHFFTWYRAQATPIEFKHHTPRRQHNNLITRSSIQMLTCAPIAFQTNPSDASLLGSAHILLLLAANVLSVVPGGQDTPPDPVGAPIITVGKGIAMAKPKGDRDPE
jgi:hypothetical protein